MDTFITAISYYLPEKIVTNQDLNQVFQDWTVDKIASKVGINQRHVVTKNETASDLAILAAEKLFKEHNIERSSIDFILLCTQSPDYFLPTSACLIQQKLGLSTLCGALDFNLGCSGFVYGLALAKGLICSGVAHNVLLLTAETYSKYIHSKDKGNRTIFGDASAATLISTEGFAKIEDFILGTDGRGAENLIVKSGGLRHSEFVNDLTFDDAGNPMSSDFLYMNGGEIFNFTADAIPTLVDNVLIKHNLSKDDIQLFVFHQANTYMLNYLRKLIEVDKDRFYYCIENVGNTVSSTIPIALYEAKKENKLIGKILIAGFGVGYSWGGAVLSCL